VGVCVCVCVCARARACVCATENWSTVFLLCIRTSHVSNVDPET